jgi:hypothetical protein
MNLRPSNKLISHSIVALLASVAFFSSSVVLAAQVGAVTDSAPAVSAGVLAWGSVTALVCTFLMNLTSSGTPTPWNWNPQVRFYLALGATTVSGILHACQTGVTIQTAAVTALGSLLAAVMAHYSTPGAMTKAAPKVAGAALLLLALGASVTVSNSHDRSPLARAASHVQVGGLTGCATLFPGLNTGTTTADISAFIQVAQTVDGFASIAWTDAQPFIPPASLASATAAWTKAQDAYQAAITVAQASLAAYTSGAAQNWVSLFAAVTSAVDAVVTVIGQFGGALPAPMGVSSEFALHVASVHSAQTTLHSFKAP